MVIIVLLFDQLFEPTHLAFDTEPKFHPIHILNFKGGGRMGADNNKLNRKGLLSKEPSEWTPLATKSKIMD